MMEVNTKIIGDPGSRKVFGALRNKIAWIMLGLFCVSWALPIIDDGYRGVFGAWLAYEGLLKGIATFIGSETLGRSPIDEGGLFGALILVYLALPNILFVAGFVLFMMRLSFSYIMFALSLPAVLYWVVIEVYSASVLANSGAYIWTLSFILMFVLSSKEYAHSKNIPYVKLFLGWESLFIYAPVTALFSGYILFQ